MFVNDIVNQIHEFDLQYVIISKIKLYFCYA